MDPVFTSTIIVQDGDIDELGHASNIAYVRWFQDVAVAHSRAAGLDWGFYAKLGAVFVIRRQEVDYLRPAKLGDRLDLRTQVINVAAAKCQRETDVTCCEDGVVIAKGLTTWGFVDVARGRPTRIPDVVRAAFGVPLRPKRHG